VKRRTAPGPAVPAAAAPPSPGLWPAWSEWIRPAEPFLVPLLLLLATRGLLWAVLPIAAEDAYITFRYAKNLAIGNGLLYNPGERVMGFSSPLWTVWSALGWRLLANPVEWARMWTVAGDVVTLVLTTAMLRKHGGRAAAWCFAWFFAGWPFFAGVAVSGMETSVMLTLMVLSAALVERGSPLSGPALAALVLVRPEGFAAALVIALGARWRDRAVALGLAGLGIASLWAYFGSPIPQSVIAKAGIYGHPGPMVGRYWWDWLVPFPMAGAPVITEGVHLFLLCVLMAPAVLAGAPILWRVRGSALGLVAGAALVIWLGYALLGVAFFFWYLVVPLFGLLVLAAIGLPRLVKGRAIYFSAALFVIGMWGIGIQLYGGRARTEVDTFGSVANFLATHARPGEKVFLEPIGLIGYRNPLVVLDEVGLVSPQVARRRAQGPGWYTDVIAGERPDWLVVRRALLSRGAGFAGRHAPFRNAAELDSLNAHYAVATTFAVQAGDQALLVLQRQR
jgi:arabinofuranosyltransferase